MVSGIIVMPGRKSVGILKIGKTTYSNYVKLLMISETSLSDDITAILKENHGNISLNSMRKNQLN